MSKSKENPVLDAGEFSAWVAQMTDAMRGARPADVPCGDCTGCCTSSQFVHVEPDDVDALAHIPDELLFPAPHAPEGHRLLGYNERGHCPMLVDGGCSIYEFRPWTCRTYDCRIFAATGVEADDDKPVIANRARQWRFRFDSDDGKIRQEAMSAAARYLIENKSELPEELVFYNATQHAVLAFRIHELFLLTDEKTGLPVVAEPKLADVITALKRI